MNPYDWSEIANISIIWPNYNKCVLQEQLSEINLAKYRKMQSDLEEAETRANVAEKLIDQLRSRAIQSVTGPEEVSVSASCIMHTLFS